MEPLSVIVITKDEERNIRDCLDSVKWASELIVVDAGSTDKTVEIAKSFTKKVFERPWEGYGEAKNFALLQCTQQWVLWLDADERVSPRLRADIVASVKKNDPTVMAYSMPRMAFFLGRWIKHCGWYPGRIVRLFRPANAKFTTSKVHEELVVKGKVLDLAGDLYHFTDPDLKHYFTKFNKYTTLAAEEAVRKGKKASLLDLLIRPVWSFKKMYFFKRGFLDGLHGFILCVVSAFYVFVKYAKIWEYYHQQREKGVSR
jgi:glycosyltransferase involved in cell wall biosynthesis